MQHKHLNVTTETVTMQCTNSHSQSVKPAVHVTADPKSRCRFPSLMAPSWLRLMNQETFGPWNELSFALEVSSWKWNGEKCLSRNAALPECGRTFSGNESLHSFLSLLTANTNTTTIWLFKGSMFLCVPPNVTTKISTYCPQWICVFRTDLEKRIIFLYGINWLVFTAERGCVYCSMQRESLNIIQVNARF